MLRLRVHSHVSLRLLPTVRTETNGRVCFFLAVRLLFQYTNSTCVSKRFNIWDVERDAPPLMILASPMLRQVMSSLEPLGALYTVMLTKTGQIFDRL